MSRISSSDKVEAMFKILCEKGPLSISSLSEEVAHLLHGKTSTMRSVMVQLLRELEGEGLVKEVGTDQYGSKLMDLTPKAFCILINMIGNKDFKLIKKETLRKALERRTPNLLPYYDLFALVTHTYNTNADFTQEFRKTLDWEIARLNSSEHNNWSNVKEHILRNTWEVLKELIDSKEIEDVLTEVSNNSSLRKVLVECLEWAKSEINEGIKALQNELHKAEDIQRKLTF